MAATDCLGRRFRTHALPSTLLSGLRGHRPRKGSKPTRKATGQAATVEAKATHPVEAAMSAWLKVEVGRQGQALCCLERQPTTTAVALRVVRVVRVAVAEVL
jgi:hypothetical protein